MTTSSACRRSEPGSTSSGWRRRPPTTSACPRCSPTPRASSTTSRSPGSPGPNRPMPMRSRAPWRGCGGIRGCPWRWASASPRPSRPPRWRPSPMPRWSARPGSGPSRPNSPDPAKPYPVWGPAFAKEATVKNGAARDALVVAHGTIGGIAAVVAAFDFDFMGGSMGVAVGDGLLAAARLAVLQEAALIVVPASGGARMQEGILSLMQMSRTTLAVEMVKEAGLPYLVLLSDPTTGGVSASFAMLGDVTLAEPGAVIGFAGARVIEETIREKLPEGFQPAEYLLEHGMVDMVVPRRELRDTIARVIDLLRRREPPTHIVTLPAARSDRA